MTLFIVYEGGVGPYLELETVHLAVTRAVGNAHRLEVDFFAHLRTTSCGVPAGASTLLLFENNDRVLERAWVDRRGECVEGEGQLF